MDGKSLLDEKKYLKYLETMKRQTSNTATIISQEKAKRGNNRLNKFKLEKNSCYTILFPVCLRVPMNLNDINDDNFSADGYQSRVPGSFDTAVTTIKQLALSDPAIAEKLAREYGVTVEALNLSNASIDTPQERAIWRRYAEIEYETEVIGKTKFSSDGLYGASYRLQPEYNDQNELVAVKGVYQEAYDFENDLINFKLQEIKELYTNGARASAPPKEMENEKKKVKDNRLIGKPRYQSVARVIVLPADNAKGTLNSKYVATLRESKGKLDKFTYWTKINSNDINRFNSVLGNEDDRHNNFVEIILEVGDGDTPLQLSQNAVQTIANSLTTAFGLDTEIGGGEEKNKSMDAIERAYKTLRDNLDEWNPDILKNSVYEFKSISDDALLGKLNNDVTVYKSILAQPEVKTKWATLLKSMNYSLTQALQERTIDEKDILTIESSTAEETKIAAESDAVEESLIESGLGLGDSEALVSDDDLAQSLIDIEGEDY